MDNDTKKAIEKQIPIYLNMKEPERSRGLIHMAHEYIDHGLDSDFFDIIRKCDPSYFKGQMADDAKNIPGMDKIVIDILIKMIDSSYIDSSVPTLEESLKKDRYEN